MCEPHLTMTRQEHRPTRILTETWVGVCSRTRWSPRQVMSGGSIPWMCQWSFWEKWRKSSWRLPPLRFSPVLMPMSLLSLLLDFYPMSLCCLWAQFKIQSYKHHQMKCVEVRMEGTDSAYRVIVLKQFFHFENLYLRPLTSFCPSSQTSPQSLGPLWPLSSLPSLFFKLWWLRKWKEYGWVESTLTFLPSGPNGTLDLFLETDTFLCWWSFGNSWEQVIRYPCCCQVIYF